MANLATGIVLTAGTITFVNEWYVKGKPEWKIPVATLLAAAVFDGLAAIDDKAATGLAVIVLLGAFTTRFNGKSVSDTVASWFSNSTTNTNTKQPVRRVAVA
jgi:hypothetical protein